MISYGLMEKYTIVIFEIEEIRFIFFLLLKKKNLVPTPIPTPPLSGKSPSPVRLSVCFQQKLYLFVFKDIWKMIQSVI